MRSLASLQLKFQHRVLGAQGTDEFTPLVITTLAADADERINVYVWAYRARLVEVLGNDFPGLRALATAETFDDLCRAYINAMPSAHYNVRWYGHGLADFLRREQPWCATAAFAEMAELEWALGLSFDAADETHVIAGQVAILAPEQWPELRLRLHDAVHRLKLSWNVGAIRHAVDLEETPPHPLAFDVPQAWIVSRQDTDVRHRRLEADEAAALEAVANGACFAELCEVLCDWHSEETVAMRAASLLRQWIENQWITELLIAG